ncbi:hypothetical protein [Arthrobacter sp.]|uniref:hypothetical protein n=1 Tax=Arthrobacter sp. TaxID=1667 RepID=UPI003A8E05CB
MDAIQLIITALGGLGVGSAVATIYASRKSAQVGMAGNEVEAAGKESANWSEFTTRIQNTIERQDKRITELEAEIISLRKARERDGGHIAILEGMIWSRADPPPPPRPI